MQHFQPEMPSLSPPKNDSITRKIPLSVGKNGFSDRQNGWLNREGEIFDAEYASQFGKSGFDLIFSSFALDKAPAEAEGCHMVRKSLANVQIHD